MATMTQQQRYGLGAAPAGAPKTMGGLSQKRKTKAITVSGKPKKFADGGPVPGDIATTRIDGQRHAEPAYATNDPQGHRRAAAENEMYRTQRAHGVDSYEAESKAMGFEKKGGFNVRSLTPHSTDNSYAKGGKVNGYADGGKVEIPRIEVTAKRMTPEEAKAYDEKESKGNEGMGLETNPDASTSAPEAVEAARRKKMDHEIHRTINGAPIRNPRPANLPVGSGGVRG